MHHVLTCQVFHWADVLHLSRAPTLSVLCQPTPHPPPLHPTLIGLALAYITWPLLSSACAACVYSQNSLFFLEVLFQLKQQWKEWGARAQTCTNTCIFEMPGRNYLYCKHTCTYTPAHTQTNLCAHAQQKLRNSCLIKGKQNVAGWKRFADWWDNLDSGSWKPCKHIHTSLTRALFLFHKQFCIFLECNMI